MRLTQRVFILLLIFAACANPIQAAQAALSCVQIANRVAFADELIESIQTLNVQTGELIKETQPTITASASLSPDGKHITFLQITKLPKVGFYVAPTDTRKAKLLTEYDLSKFADGMILPSHYKRTTAWEWSPDNVELAYITNIDDKGWLNIINLTTGNIRKTLVGTLEKKGSIVKLEHWSADGKYIAAMRNTGYRGVTKLSIWSAQNLAQEPTMFTEAQEDVEVGSVADWYPTGHQIAVLRSGNPVQLIVWSPEKGIQATTDLETFGNAGFVPLTVLTWFPDGKYLELSSQDWDDLFAFDGNKLFEHPAKGSDFRYVIGSTGNGSVILLDQFGESSRLYEVDILHNIEHTLQTDVVEPFIQGGVRLLASPDKKYFAFFTKTQQGAISAYIASMDGKHIKEIWHNDSYIYVEVDWSPHGKYAIFKLNYGHEEMIFVKPDGEIQQTVLGSLVDWITDDWIVYNYTQDDKNQTGVMNLQTGKSMTIGSIYEPFLVLSPDSTMLAGTVDVDQVGLISIENNHLITHLPAKALYTYTPDLQASFNKLTKENIFAWSPDSSVVAYVDDNTLIVLGRDGKLIRKTPIEKTDYPILQWTDCS